VKYAHFVITTDGEQTGVEHLAINATGDATCTGPSMKAKITASDTLEGTQQSTKVKESIVQIKNKVWLKSAKKNAKWTKSKAKVVTVLSIQVTNPLLCPSGASGSGTSGSSPTDQLKNLVNLGPETFKGVSVWHIQGILIDASGQTPPATLDFLVSQDHFLLYVYSVTVVDPTQQVTLVQKQVLTNFGKKIIVKAPKVGSKKP